MFLLQTNMNREGKVETVKSDAKSGGWVSYSAKLKMGPHDQISCQYWKVKRKRVKSVRVGYLENDQIYCQYWKDWKVPKSGFGCLNRQNLKREHMIKSFAKIQHHSTRVLPENKTFTPVFMLTVIETRRHTNCIAFECYRYCWNLNVHTLVGLEWYWL